MPCWLAGRYYPQSSLCFQLKSQGLSVDCKQMGLKFKLKTGGWIAVKLLSKDNNKYRVSEYKALNSPVVEFRESGFSYSQKGRVVQAWENFLNAVKEFFYFKGLAYADTPGLVQCPGTEPHLKAFQMDLEVDGQSQKVYLPTSPEMHLKKLLCQDWTDFFEIKKCYRNGEFSRLHQAEFTLLEWYRAFYSTEELMRETYDLLSFLQKKDFFKVPLPQTQIYTIQELFKKHLDFSLTPKTSQKEMLSLLPDQNLSNPSELGFEDVFFLIFLNHIEPKLPRQTPVFVCNYPPQLRAFSRLNSEGWANRFELFWQGLELANAFYEVIDPKEQKSLFKKHIEQRRDGAPWDKELISLMKQGMPPVSGIALGLDRLFLAIYKKKDLRETRLFPL